MSNNSDPGRTYNLLVFASERVGLTPPEKAIRRANYTLAFEPYNTARRFTEFDGVILFQGIFEEVKEGPGTYGGSPWVHVNRDKEGLDRRQKELEMLLEQGGLACFLLCKPFIDQADHGHANSSDLAKITLTYRRFYRNNFPSRVPSLDINRNEFLRFLKLYGAASSHFSNLNHALDLRPIATARSHLVGFIIDTRSYYVPTLIPPQEAIEEYFDLLAEALTSTANKLAISIPEWIDSYKFSEEATLLVQQKAIELETQRIATKIQELQDFKRVLIGSDEALRGDVALVLRKGFGFQIDDADEYREDLKIVDEEKKPVAFVEVKGINAGVRLEHVNQADSHRERAGLPPTFPALLIVNTHIKNARNLGEKNKPVGKDQVERAANNRVLVLRTLDLVALLQLVKDGRMTSQQVLDLLTRHAGWLQVWGLDAPLVVEA